jgi:taurine dioxygenase
MHFRPLSESPFGISVEYPGASISDLEMAELRQLLDRHGLMVIRGQRLSEIQQADMVAAFGRVEINNQGAPFLMQVTNQYEDSSAPQGELGFHFDYSYDPRPTSVISLYGDEIVDGVTPTLFAQSTISPHEMPAELYKAIKGREAAHACFPEQFSYEFMQVHKGPSVIRGEQGWNSGDWWMRKPVTASHIEDRETLYLCELYTHSLIGVPESESKTILSEIYGLLYKQSCLYTHQWQPDDLVIWDNLRVQHARPVPNDKKRTLRRFHTAEDDLTEDYLRVGRESDYL